jgi:HlyD family secretion protein
MRKMIPTALLVLAACNQEAGDSIEATGTLEVVEVNVSATVPARIVKILVVEGQVVRQGDTLAVLTQPTLPGEEQQRGARSRAARAMLQELERGARPGELQRAEADLAAAEADAARAARDAERLRGLAERQVVSATQYDAARTLAASTASRRDALAANLKLLRDGASDERIRAARAESEAAEAAVETSRASERDLVLRAPVAGVVSSRNVEPGEVVTAGAPVMTISEQRRQTVRVFVNQASLSRVNPGQVVDAALDAYPDRRFTGRVASIATRAEFTPRVALTEKERSDLLFAVKVEFADTTGMLKAGLPITVHIEAPVPGAKDKTGSP